MAAKHDDDEMYSEQFSLLKPAKPSFWMTSAQKQWNMKSGTNKFQKVANSMLEVASWWCLCIWCYSGPLSSCCCQWPLPVVMCQWTINKFTMFLYPHWRCPQKCYKWTLRHKYIVQYMYLFYFILLHYIPFTCCHLYLGCSDCSVVFLLGDNLYDTAEAGTEQSPRITDIKKLC